MIETHARALRDAKLALVNQIADDLILAPQTVIAKRIGVSQAEVSKLLARKLDIFSLERLLSISLALGYRATIILHFNG